MNVSVQIVTFNSAPEIRLCLESLSKQSYDDFRIRILDNASSDDTLSQFEDADVDIIPSDVNLGFAAGHNKLATTYPAPYILFLNPDTVLEPAFIGTLVRALEDVADAGSAMGKLLRMDGRTLDSTGIIMTRNQRHLDRGAGELDQGQYDQPGPIFGPSAAAALYRFACLEDVAFDGQFFDEDFFAYREDADLAWRCRLMGWQSLYVPQAVARHKRRVTPERRASLPKEINRHSVKNRFLLRINNMTPELYRRDYREITKRDLAVIGYVLSKEWSSISGLLYILGECPRLWRKRRMIQGRIRARAGEVESWFQ